MNTELQHSNTLETSTGDIETREVYNRKHERMLRTIRVSDIKLLEGFNNRVKISADHVNTIQDGTYDNMEGHDGSTQRDPIALSADAELLEGEHRYRAALKQAEETGEDVWMQFIIRSTQRGSWEEFMQHIEENRNDKREWSATEWGRAFTRAKKQHGKSQADIAREFGVTSAHVSNCIKAYKETCEEIQKLNADGIVTLQQIQLLTGKSGKNARKRVPFEAQKKLADTIREIHNQAVKDQEEKSHKTSQAKTRAFELARAALDAVSSENSDSEGEEGEGDTGESEGSSDSSSSSSSDTHSAPTYSLIPRAEFRDMISADFAALEATKAKKHRAAQLANLTGKATMLGYDGPDSEEEELRAFFAAFSGLEGLTGEGESEESSTTSETESEVIEETPLDDGDGEAGPSDDELSSLEAELEALEGE